MNQPPVEAPADRLKHLEQEAARLSARVEQASRRVGLLQWSFFGLILALAGGVVGLFEAGILHIEGLSPSVARRVEAKEFGFYNRFDTRVVLEADDKFGLPQLIFMDLQKRYRLGIKVWPEGDGTPGLVFYDQSGMRGNFRMDGDGATVLNLVGEGQKGGIAMSVAADGTPSLKLTDKAGKVLFQVPATSN